MEVIFMQKLQLPTSPICAVKAEETESSAGSFVTGVELID
jgi:hypothetical protein